MDGAENGRPPVLSIRDLEVDYVTPAGVAHAVRGVSLNLHRNESVALIGESGSSKTSAGKLAAGLRPPTSGAIRFRGRDIWRLGTDEFKEYRRAV